MRPLLLLLFPLAVIAASYLSGFAASEQSGQSEKAGGVQAEQADPAIDRLLGGDGRARHAERIGKLVFAGGKRYPWEQFAAWGRELFFNGMVGDPPAGEESKRISDFYTCARCHNVRREDPVLTKQDPEARFAMLRKSGDPDFWMTQGTTLWGAVNRVAFYNGLYASYHDLCVPESTDGWHLPCGPLLVCMPGCRAMDPAVLEDATQICSRYCSVGRYEKEWEICSMLAFFWDMELKLSNLDLPSELEREVLAHLNPPVADAKAVAKYRALLRDHFLLSAGETYRGMPRFEGHRWALKVGPFPDGKIYKGDPARGEKLYAHTCGHCHGTEIFPVKGKALVGDLEYFYRILAKGTTERSRAYMPEFTLERLSLQQSEDIRAYLQSLP